MLGTITGPIRKQGVGGVVQGHSGGPMDMDRRDRLTIEGSRGYGVDD